MSEMVERVARVLEPQAWAALGTGDTLAYLNRRKSSLRKARRAIEAMREPTETMLGEAFWSAHDERADLVWRDMIEAALAPDQSGRLPADAAQVDGEGSRESP